VYLVDDNGEVTKGNTNDEYKPGAVDGKCNSEVGDDAFVV